MSRRRRFALAVLAGIVTLAGLAGITKVLIHHYDPTRVIYRRLSAPDRFAFEEIHPRFFAVNARELVTVRTAEDVAARRRALVAAIWGRFGYPDRRLPAAVEERFDDPVLARLAGVARVDRLAIDIAEGVRAHVRYLQAARGNGRLVIYHHGYAGTVHQAGELIGALAERGFDVLAANMMGYGDNAASYRLPDGSSANLHYGMDRIDTPLRFHFEAPIVALNHALRAKSYRSVDMIGFSAGAFTAAVLAAVEPRIELSFPVAGVYPNYLRVGQDVHPNSPQDHPALLAAADYLDMFVLGAAGTGRGQIQVFNRFDRCCFNNRKGKLYEPAVAEAAAALAGRFAVVIDESHADHKISAFARRRIIAELERGGGGR